MFPFDYSFPLIPVLAYGLIFKKKKGYNYLNNSNVPPFIYILKCEVGERKGKVAKIMQKQIYIDT